MSINIGYFNGTTTITKLRLTTNYPNTPAMDVKVTDTASGKSYDATKTITELNLIETIQSLKLKEPELKKLVDAIEEYGSEQYRDGDFNATYEG